MKHYDNVDSASNWKSPVYNLNEEQMLNFTSFIRMIKLDVEKWGMCKIIPPPSRRLVFPNQLKFSNKIIVQMQHIHNLQKTQDFTDNRWHEEYNNFLKKSEKKGKLKAPVLGGMPLDLEKLYSVVNDKGGYHHVSQHKEWKSVANYMTVMIFQI